MGDLPHRVKPDPDGRYTVDVHVTPDGNARIGDREYSPEEFADILRRNGDYDGRPIRLIGCDASSNDFAQRLSRELDTEVLAPNKPAWTDSNGNVFSSDYEIGPDGKPRPKIPPNGEWSTHSPDGSTTRASDDGFTPDTPDGNKTDVDADGARSRGEDAPDGDPDTRPSQDPDEEPWRRQERELTDPERQQEFRRNPQHSTDFKPSSRSDGAPGSRQNPYEVGPNGDSGVRPPKPGERFPTDQKLKPNSAYRVVDEKNNLRGIYHTDGSCRVTHIETTHPNVPRSVLADSKSGYDPNPDLRDPHPNTTYRVEIEGRHQVFDTDSDGMPNPGVEFHRPRFDNEETISRTDPRAPGGRKSFASGGPYDPHTRYEVWDKKGVYRGTFHTDVDGNVRWAEVESGRVGRTNKDLDGISKHAPDADLRLRQQIDPDARAPEGYEERDFGEPSRVKLDPKESFLPRKLDPETQYVVTSRTGEEDYVRSVYWTDKNCDVIAVETVRPHNPDMNNPSPNMVYEVDGGKFVYRTGPEISDGGTDTVLGQGNDLSRAADGSLPRRDGSAQSESNSQGDHVDPVTGSPPVDPLTNSGMEYDGGHFIGNEFYGPGELLNMMAQWRSQNQSKMPDNWWSMERELADYLKQDGNRISRFEVFPLREDGVRAPHEIQVRWVEIDADGTRRVHLRSFPNLPTGGGQP